MFLIYDKFLHIIYDLYITIHFNIILEFIVLYDYFFWRRELVEVAG